MTTTLGSVVLDQVADARGPWSAVVKAGDVLTMIDLHGNQAVDTLLYAADDHALRYSAAATVTPSATCSSPPEPCCAAMIRHR